MSKETWIALLSFLIAVLEAAQQAFTPSPDVSSLINFAVIVLGLVLGAFFGVKPILQARAAKQVK